MESNQSCPWGELHCKNWDGPKWEWFQGTLSHWWHRWWFWLFSLRPWTEPSWRQGIQIPQKFHVWRLRPLTRVENQLERPKHSIPSLRGRWRLRSWAPRMLRAMQKRWCLHQWRMQMPQGLLGLYLPIHGRRKCEHCMENILVTTYSHCVRTNRRVYLQINE